jgi:hypothetical protein
LSVFKYIKNYVVYKTIAKLCLNFNYCSYFKIYKKKIMVFFLNLDGTQGIEIRCRISTVRYITHGKGMSARNQIHTSPLGLNVNDNPHAKDSGYLMSTTITSATPVVDTMRDISHGG